MNNKIYKLITLGLVLFTLLSISSPVSAQSYSFSIDKQIVDVFWEDDGTLTLRYEFQFTNYGDPIDFVDVGMPNASFNLASASASIDGQQINHIEYSPYVENGIELGLGSNAIPPGQTGTVRFQISGISNVLYQDSEDSNYTSAVFIPTWFGSEFIRGTTELTVIYHFPLEVMPEEPRWHQAPSGFPAEPEKGFDSLGRITYTWTNTSANMSGQYKFGASFPIAYVPATTVSTPSFWQNIGIDPEALIGWACFCGFGLLFLGIPVLSIRSARKRKLKYLPPKLAIEGHGIKRGLTAIEAAILLEQPMDKILTMTLFSTIKKEAAKVVSRDPLE